MREELEALAVRLEAAAPRAASLPVVIGFDAFVDEVLEVVGVRHSPDSYSRLATIAGFAGWAADSAGKSGLREAVLKERAAGGCAVNMGDGLAALGFPLDAFAAVGDPPDDVFSPFQNRCRSLRAPGMAPGRTIVMEFDDGKLMLCSYSHFAAFTPGHLRGVLEETGYRQACEGAAAVVLTSWSVFPHMTACWRYLQAGALAGLPRRPRIFLDLADPASRSAEDIVAMVEALAGFDGAGPTTLSLNASEANRLARALGLREAGGSGPELERLASELRERARIEEVGIHTVDSAITAREGATHRVPGPHCARPRKSVGAGDRFNAGWLAGFLLDLPPRDRLLLAAAASGFFVRAARSATLPEIAAFIRSWARGEADSTPGHQEIAPTSP